MGDYFRPWRRKLGVVTLVLAWVFTAGWVRSVIGEDSIDFTSPLGNGSVTSRYGLILVVFDKCDGMFFGRSFALRNVCWGEDWSSTEEHQGSKWLAQHGWFTYFANGCREDHIYIPYWELMIPLTMLSAHLLLSKPRQPKQPADITAASESSSTGPGDRTRA